MTVASGLETVGPETLLPIASGTSRPCLASNAADGPPPHLWIPRLFSIDIGRYDLRTWFCFSFGPRGTARSLTASADGFCIGCASVFAVSPEAAGITAAEGSELMRTRSFPVGDWAKVTVARAITANARRP